MTRPSERAEDPDAFTISIENAEHGYPTSEEANSVRSHALSHNTQWGGANLQCGAPTAIRARSFGEQQQLQAAPSGFRRRAQSDSASFSALNFSAYQDQYAVDDEDSDVPQFTPYHAPHWTSQELQPPSSHLSPPLHAFLTPAWMSNASSSPSSWYPGRLRLPSSADQTDPDRQPTTSTFPSPLSPSLLSPSWRSEVDSDASSVRSVSPSLNFVSLPSPAIANHGVYEGGSPDLYHRSWHMGRHFIPSADSSVGGIDDNMKVLSIDGDGTTNGSSYSDHGLPHQGQGQGLPADPSWLVGHFPPVQEQQQRPSSFPFAPFPPDSYTAPTASSSSQPPPEGRSLDEAASSRNHLYAPAPDAFYSLTGLKGGDASQLAQRTPRRHTKSHGPYPTAGPSRVASGQTTNWIPQDEPSPGDSTITGSGHPQNPSTPDVPASPQSWNHQSEQEGPSKSPTIRPVATDATRRASAARRKDPSKRGPFVCELCGHDFTAKHNYQNHINSHNSVKPFECEKCSQRFVTQHVLKRHDSKCSSRSLSKKRRS
ncbi:hypothetical protein DFH07DRAFT_458246 [Mycena maculata]|uniref:C2H2-type domain-containing protein n=1 Tax=Mycena maculata TaxID=230809 RepID=A0AAD7J898_9AGAR|nr:hypothetical protein DFH07DRAFT_458246 [Mycena maculata]